MPRQNRKAQVPGQKRISDFFQKADEPAAPPSGMKRAVVDDSDEPNKRQMTESCSLMGEGQASVGDTPLSPLLPSSTPLPVPPLPPILPPSPQMPSDRAMKTQGPSDRALPHPIPSERTMINEGPSDRALPHPISSDGAKMIEHNEDESDEEGNWVGHTNALIEDDEFIPFEDEDEDEGNEFAALDAAESDSVAQSNNEVMWDIFEPNHQRPRVESADINAEQYVKKYDEAHPVDRDDEDLKRFETNFTRLIQGFVRWADQIVNADWFGLSRGEREMTLGFQAIFQRAAGNPASLVRICLDGMPRQVQKILGKEDLSEIDFLDLPVIPPVCKHRLVYVDVATRLPQDQVKKELRSSGSGRKLFKTRTPTCDLKEALGAKLYVGSSVNKLGSYNRIREHEAIANGHYKVAMNMHYTEVSKPDVLCNFRMLGIWQNPYANKSYDGQDPSRWVAPMVEGLVMAYLGLYTEANKSYVLTKLFPPRSYRLISCVRNGLSLPDFSNTSLNRAWSLCQGTSGSLKMVQLCANPECRRPRVVSEGTLLGTKGTTHFQPFAAEDLLSPYYCLGCSLYYSTYGKMRTREGTTTGRWRHETDFDAINLAWLAAGHDRKCQNAGCKVLIHPAANLYGIENGIKCLRCHQFGLLHHEDYAPVHKDDDQTGDCQVCQRQDVRIFSWDKIDLRNDADLPTELCGNCYVTRCSFLQDEVPADARPKTVAGCGNVACWDMTRRSKANRSSGKFIENIDEHIWRCARCDYCHQIGIEKPNKHLQNLPKPPIGPVASHRFNATKCVDCERYSSYDEWQKVDGGYRCGSCVGLKCSDCTGDPAVYPVRIRSDGQARCFLCHEVSRHGNTGVREAAYQKISANRTCCNAPCTATGRDKTLWFFDPEDKTRYRCHRCHNYFKKHGKDWRPGSKCYNESCTENGTDVKWMTGPDGNVRCRPCFTAFVITGAERPLNGRCHNFAICGRDHTNYSKGFTCDGKGDGNVRCTECHRYWVDTGRQFEKNPNLPRLTKAEIDARVCSRPGCHARKSVQWYRWKEFVPNGWLCKECFKGEKAAQRQANQAAYAARAAAARTAAAGTATVDSQHEDPGDPDAIDGPVTNHSEE